MQTELAADDVWFPAVRFADGGPLLGGEVSYPLPSFLTADEALGLAQSADRLIAWATAMKMRAVARVEEAVAEEMPPRDGSQPMRFGGEEAHALAVTEVATACAVSEGSAAQSVNDAVELTTCQWEVLEAVEEGKISPAHARVILEQARSLPAAHHGEFSRIALLRTRTRQGRLRTAVELRTSLRRLRERLHPESLSSRKASARRERGVWFTPERDGMCTITAYLPAEAGLPIFNGLDRDARLASARAAEADTYQVPGTAAAPGSRTPPRTLPEYRADALAYRLLGGSSEGIGPFRPEVVVTIPVGQVLAGVPAAAPFAHEAGATGLRTAELQGYGPIDADTALRLAALAPNWHRLFTDFSTGQALGVGRTAYRPPRPCSDTCTAGTARAGFRVVPARREDAKWTTPSNGRTVGTPSRGTWHCCAEGTMPSSPSVPGAMSICPMAAIFDGALRWAGPTAPVPQTPAQWTGMRAAPKPLNRPQPQSLRYLRHSRNHIVLHVKRSVEA
ncbi:DUF222 domain-containing protein [Arthrobacter sp. SD76]|uniref:DUF222 domain-containing protein n=1 Tax=Arthrobacter sp. SD76 TaxID=3415007 RepID=UPI003C78440C